MSETNTSVDRVVKRIKWECPVCKTAGTAEGEFAVMDMAMAHDPVCEKDCEDNIQWLYV